MSSHQLPQNCYTHLFCRTAGNAAYILGTLAEQETGQLRVLSLINGSYPHQILADLTDMLSFNDAESVMNAAGTIGTLVSFRLTVQA